LKNSDLATTYLQTTLEAQHRDAVRNSLSSEVLQHYKDIETAFASGNANALKGAVIARSQ